MLTLAQATAQCILDGVSQLDVARSRSASTSYMNPKTVAEKKAAKQATRAPQGRHHLT